MRVPRNARKGQGEFFREEFGNLRSATAEGRMINPKTGKGWTDEEESAFTEIQKCSRLNRIEAIKLFRRFKGDVPRALAIAKQLYPPASLRDHRATREG